jgi:hypothetical protein
MHIASIGVDLGKTTFHQVALGEQGKVVVRKKFSRKQLLAYTANLKNSLVGIEACSGAHFIGAALRSQGHDVRLIPAQFVKPYVKSNKNDFLDAEAIAEAVTRQNMRFVPIKTGDQLDLHSIVYAIGWCIATPRSSTRSAGGLHMFSLNLMALAIAARSKVYAPASTTPRSIFRLRPSASIPRR